IALGATPGRVAARVVTESLANVVIGLAVGLLLALAAGRVLEGLLVGVSGRDPLTLVTVLGAMAMAAAAASLVPVLRGTRVDPSVALRAE
ncbi:MAG: permease, partial [Acidobacteriota bacterium]|nr:permease [Acidobacteriota bacterium]